MGNLVFQQALGKRCEFESSQLLASCRTLVVNFLTKEKLKSIRAKIETFVDDFNQFFNFFKKKKFYKKAVEKISIKRMRKMAAWNLDYLIEILNF